MRPVLPTRLVNTLVNDYFPGNGGIAEDYLSWDWPQRHYFKDETFFCEWFYKVLYRVVLEYRVNDRVDDKVIEYG